MECNKEKEYDDTEIVQLTPDQLLKIKGGNSEAIIIDDIIVGG